MTPPSSVPGRRSWSRTAGYALWALVFAFFQARVIAILMPNVLERSAQVIEGVLIGEPHWRVYQSRVLGPYLVEALKGFAGGLPAAYAAFAILILFASGFSVLALTDRLRDPRRPPITAFLLLQSMFVFMIPCIWLYPWDLVSLVVFTTFNYLVLRRASRAGFALLYAIAVLNHEIAHFIPAWLLLDAIARYVAGRGGSAGFRRVDWSSGALGLGLMVAGIAVVEGLRNALLVREAMVAADLPKPMIYGKSFHVALAQNWSTFVESFSWDWTQAYPFTVPLFLLAVLAVAVRLFQSDRARFGALSAVTAGMVAALLCFGLVFETRVLLPLVPFVAMNGPAVLPGLAPRPEALSGGRSPRS